MKGNFLKRKQRNKILENFNFPVTFYFDELKYWVDAKMVVVDKRSIEAKSKTI